MSEKILLIDDDEDFRSEFKDSLEGYEVIEASSGEEALKLLNKPNEIDLVILDVVMPGLGGMDVLKEIRKVSPDLGTIILTGYSSVDVAVEALRGHASDFIEKPIDVDKMKETIERVLELRRNKSFINMDSTTGKVERIKRFAERNCYKKTCLKDAAATIYLSPKYLSRIFKQSTGTRFSEFKLDIKIKEAKNLLTETSYNINQIADKLGYQNAESFIRIFKKITGCTPTEYRKKNQNLPAASLKN